MVDSCISTTNKKQYTLVLAIFFEISCFFYFFDFAVSSMKTEEFSQISLCKSFGFDRWDSRLSRNQGVKKRSWIFKENRKDQHILFFVSSWNARIDRLFCVRATFIFGHLPCTSLFCPLHELPVALQIVKQLLVLQRVGVFALAFWLVASTRPRHCYSKS